MGVVRAQLPTLEEAAALGAALVEVDAALLRHPPGGRRRWLTGGEPYLNVSIEDDERGLSFVEARFRGRFVRRSRGGALATGESDELEVAQPMPASKVERLTAARTEVLDVVRALLSARGLHEEARWLLDGAG
ncbi:MAG: hypothetical protein HYS27_15910 [Deltaproteobacteria bacterium]|nr:hypothetical protein [Deltaproteobacteria bacterium]